MRLVVGALMGVGLWLLILGIRNKKVVSFSGGGRSWELTNQNLKKILLGIAVGAALWALTGIFTAGLVVGLGIGIFQGKLGSKKDMRHRADKSEAIANWTEVLYSILLAGGGIEKAIIVSAPIAPELIKSEIRRLSERLETHSLFEALSMFGQEMSHPVSDKIVAALSLSVTQGAQELVDLLKSQAESARADSRLVIELESGRSRHRTSAFIVMGVTLTVAAGLYILEEGYLEPYRTFPGYLVLLFVGGGFMLGFWLLIKMGSDSAPQRYFELGESI